MQGIVWGRGGFSGVAEGVVEGAEASHVGGELLLLELQPLALAPRL